MDGRTTFEDSNRGGRPVAVATQQNLATVKRRVAVVDDDRFCRALFSTLE